MEGNVDIRVAIEDLDAEIQEASRSCDFALARKLKRRRDKLAKKAARSGGSASRASVSERAGSTRRVVDFQSLSTAGIMRVDDGHYACALEVDDVNYISARPDEQGDVRKVWSDYLNALDHTVSVQFHLASKRISDDEFISLFDMDPVPGDEAGNALRAEYEAYCREKLEGSSRSMSRTRIAVIKVTAPTREKAVPALAREAERLVRALRDLDSDARVLDGQAWLDAICAITRPDDEPGVVDMRELGNTVGLTARDLAAPSSIERVDAQRGDSRMIIGGRRWVRTYVLTLDGYGSSMRDSFISDLSSLPYDIVVSWHVRPWESDAAMSAVETHLTRINEENDTYKKNRSDPSRGYFVDDETLPSVMRDARAEAQSLRDDIVNFDMRTFSVTTVVLVTGRSEEELEAACGEVESVFSTHRKPQPDSWSALREQSLTTALPIGNCRLPYGRTLTTDPLSHMLMWASAELLDRGGTLMGINPYTRGFELYDPALEEHTNSFTLAMPRSGKSMNAKLTRIIQTHLRRPDDDVIIIDPENEYSACTQMLGGQVINISENSAEHINPLDINAYYGSENPDSMTNPVPSKVSFIQALVHMMASQVTEIQTNLIDQASRFAYSRWQADPREDNVPTLQDVYDFLASVEGSSADDAHQLAQMIERFVSGTLGVFNHRTNVDISNRLVDFVLSDLSAELKPIAMLVMLDHIWVRVTANRTAGRRTWLIVDEFQLLLDDPYAVDKFDRFFTRGGKWDLYNLGITQNLSRLLDIPQTRYMLQNCPMLTIMKQSPDGAREIAELLGLSAAQERFIRTAGRGQGLYCFKNMVVPFDFTINERTCPELYALATTKPDDLRRLKMKRATPEREPAQPTRTMPVLDLEEPEGQTAWARAVEAEAALSATPAGSSGRQAAPAPARVDMGSLAAAFGDGPAAAQGAPRVEPRAEEAGHIPDAPEAHGAADSPWAAGFKALGSDGAADAGPLPPSDEPETVNHAADIAAPANSGTDTWSGDDAAGDVRAINAVRAQDAPEADGGADSPWAAGFKALGSNWGDAGEAPSPEAGVLPADGPMPVPSSGEPASDNHAADNHAADTQTPARTGMDPIAALDGTPRRRDRRAGDDPGMGAARRRCSTFLGAFSEEPEQESPAAEPAVADGEAPGRPVADGGRDAASAAPNADGAAGRRGAPSGPGDAVPDAPVSMPERDGGLRPRGARGAGAGEVPPMRSRHPREVRGAVPPMRRKAEAGDEATPRGDSPRRAGDERPGLEDGGDGRARTSGPSRSSSIDAAALFQDEVFMSMLGELIEERTSCVDVEASFASLGAGGGIPRRGPEPEDGFAAVPRRDSAE